MNGDRFTPIGLGHRAALMPDRDVTQVPMRQPAPGRGFPITHVTYERGAKGPSTVEFMLEQDWCRSMDVLITAQGVTVDGEPRRYAVVGDVMQIHGPLVAVGPESVTDREQAAFEAWAERNAPSGDVERVQQAWERSADFADFWAEEQAKEDEHKAVLPRRAEPPRRLDIRQDKPAFYTQFDVYLDGVKQSRCVVADADKSYVERYLPNPAPWLTRFARRTERKSGTVVIVWRDDPLTKE